MGAAPLPPDWMNIVAATDGGLFNQQTTEGAVAVKLEGERFAQQAPNICLWAGRTCSTTQEAYTAESGAVERVLHSAPEGAGIGIWMDALGRMRSIRAFPHTNARSQLRIAGRSHLRRIHALIDVKNITARFGWTKAHKEEHIPVNELQVEEILNG